MKTGNKNCCEWREKVELAIERGEKSLLDETIYCWIRFSEIGEKGFNCSTCQSKMVEWGQITGLDLNNLNLSFETAWANVQTGKVKCCEVVNLIDLNDPVKSVLYQHSWSIKEVFEGKLCFACLVKVNGVLVTVGSGVGK